MFPALLISALLLAQIPLRPAEGGAVTGIIKDSAGKPVPGVRVAAVTLQDAIKEGNTAAGLPAPAAMSGIAQTDALGRYTLDGIPQGRYYIAAGRVDQQTYYPGTRDMTAATIVSVMPGATLQEINFTLNASSNGRADGGIPTLTIPLQVRSENGGRVPVFFAGMFPELQLTGSPVATSVPLLSSSIDVYGPGDYQVSVGNLPEGYTLQSVTYGAKDITQGTLKLSASDFVKSSGYVYLSPGVFAGVINQIPVSPTDLVNRTVAPSTLTITLRDAAPSVRSDNGVRVKGRIPREKRSVYISGTPGIIYSDGTFEFTNVQPGLHTIVALKNLNSGAYDASGILGALVAVGVQDIDRVELNPVGVLPTANVRLARDPQPIGALPPGSVVPMATLAGQVVEEISKMPIKEGLVRIWASGTRAEVVISEGRFEIPRLFPGTYTLNIEIFGHSRVQQIVTVGTENITLDLTIRRLY